MRMKEDAMLNGQLKLANYEISKTKKYKIDISRRENMTYDEKEDVYLCKAGRRLTVIGIKRSKSKTPLEEHTF
ncbi:hypothetical protein [Cellulosilyticum ruminicola]|uniref:hypothetical protein n=1 Tax=Cellulosilyticum ruminicola TaxID=425254 RepID=UPI0006D1C3F3|nr:hypothetical protein [Cellulosilyticum ruminicola]